MEKVILLLANSPDSPEGDTQDRIEFFLSLTPLGEIDQSAHPPWLATRFQPGQDPQIGELIAVDDGWALRPAGDEDGPLWPLQIRTLRPGEYATLRPPDKPARLYRVIAVEQT
jgi:hypothetical protein